jgi:hypothetical protein
MVQNRNKPNTANFFWEGVLTNYEVASINSFVNNNFKVNLWTYSQNSFSQISKDVEIKDASEILPINLLRSLNQNFQKANYSSFSNLFRYRLLNVYGGWWFDTDCFCLKNVSEFKKIISGREYVLGLERENYVGSAVMYFTETELLENIENHAYQVIKKNKNKLKWGEIGPDLITEIIISNGLIDNVLNPNYFFPIPPNNISKLFDPNTDMNYFNDAFICHSWNEMFRKYNINKEIFPPRNSFLFNQLEINQINYENNQKIYSKPFILRFNPIVSILFKIYSRMKVSIKNFKQK